MLVREKELRRRFERLADDELLRVLTVERAKYRPEALAVAEMVLMHRGVAPPVHLDALGPPASPVKGRARAKSPYQFIDLCVDALLALLVVWALEKLGDWTETPGHAWGHILYWALTLGLLGSVFSLREKWRTKEWRG